MTFARRSYIRPPRSLPTVDASLFRLPEPVGMSEAVPKGELLRSEEYRRWTAEQPCGLCKVVGYSQAAHGNAGKSMGRKVSDALLFPACGPRGLNIGCHQRIDLSVDLTRDERRALESRLIAEHQALAAAHGWNLSTLTRKA